MRRDDRLERVRRESKQTQDKLDHATHLSRKLTDDVDAIANNISMALRMAPAHYHHGNAKQERLARIDSILNRLDEPLPPASRRRGRRKLEKWSRLHSGASTVQSSVIKLAPVDTSMDSKRTESESSIFRKSALRPHQKTFNALHNQAAEMRKKREQMITEKRLKEESMAKVKIVPRGVDPRTLLPSASAGRFKARTERESDRNKGLDLVIQDIVKKDFDDFAITRARQRKRWAKERRDAAMLSKRCIEISASEETAQATSPARDFPAATICEKEVLNDAASELKLPEADSEKENVSQLGLIDEAPLAMIGSKVEDFDVEAFFAEVENEKANKLNITQNITFPSYSPETRSSTATNGFDYSAAIDEITAINLVEEHFSWPDDNVNTTTTSKPEPA